MRRAVLFMPILEGFSIIALLIGGMSFLEAQEGTRPPGALGGHDPQSAQEAILLRPERVFDGEQGSLHENWVVLVVGPRVQAVGPAESISAPPGAREVPLPGLTLLPGLIEGHAHLLLHPYDETPWTDQVLLESLAERTARGVVHA